MSEFVFDIEDTVVAFLGLGRSIRPLLDGVDGLKPTPILVVDKRGQWYQSHCLLITHGEIGAK